MKRQNSASSDGQQVKRTMLDGKGILRHKNRQLGVTLSQFKEELSVANKKIKQLERDRDLFDATSSSIDRAWRLLDEDLHNLAIKLGIQIKPQEAPHAESIGNGTSLTLPSTSRLIQTLAEASDKYILADATKLNGTEEESEEEDEEEEGEATDGNGKNKINLESVLRQRLSWTNELLASILEAKDSNPAASANHLGQIRSLQAKARLLKTKLVTAKTKISELEQAAEDSRNEIWRLSRRIANLEEKAAIETKAAAAPQTTTTTSSTSEISAAPTPTPPIPAPSPPALDPFATLTDQPHMQHAPDHEKQELKAALEEIREIADSRLEEIKQLQEQIKSQILSNRPNFSEHLTEYSSPGEFAREMERLKQEQIETLREADRSKQIAFSALSKLKAAEERLSELQTASDAISKVAESEIAKENSKLKRSLDEARRSIHSLERDLESKKSQLAQASEFEKTLNAVVEEKKILKKKLENFEKGQPGAEESELIAELETMSSMLESQRDNNSRLQKTITERDKRISEIQAEKAALETELREIREEKNTIALRSEKVQAVLHENEGLVARLEERLTQEKQASQKAEELAKVTREACEKAFQERETFKREADSLKERAQAIVVLEEELKNYQLKNEEIHFELSRSEEEVKTLKRRLERAKAALEAAANTSSARQNQSAQSIDEMRLEGMTTALRCPVYQHLWKDCVIKTCAHMFSRKALEDNLAQRNRKCPSCKNTYSKDDIISVYLYQSNDYE